MPSTQKLLIQPERRQTTRRNITAARKTLSGMELHIQCQRWSRSTGMWRVLGYVVRAGNKSN